MGGHNSSGTTGRKKAWEEKDRKAVKLSNAALQDGASSLSDDNNAMAQANPDQYKPSTIRENP